MINLFSGAFGITPELKDLGIVYSTFHNKSPGVAVLVSEYFLTISVDGNPVLYFKIFLVVCTNEVTAEPSLA
jgi:hypothetical protein